MRNNFESLHALYPELMLRAPTPVPDWALDGLPIWIKGAVKVFQVTLHKEPEGPFLFLIMPEQGIAFEHMLRVYRKLVGKLDAPVLLIADNLSPKHRPLLVKFRVAFIYKNESIFAPELGLKFNRLKRFQEDQRIRIQSKDPLSPFALKIVSGLLTHQVPGEFTLKILHERIQGVGVDISSSKISLALKQLVENGLIHAVGAGPTRQFAMTKVEATWEKMLALPIVPFFREAEINFVPHNKKNHCIAGETALAHYSNLTAGTTPVIAMTAKEFRELYEEKLEESSPGIVSSPNIIQIWKEPPSLFAIGGVMNPVEVFLSIRNHHDERVQMAISEMLATYGLKRSEV